jgi:TetR/AcrR family transcriptional repressor of lmrAB and yxaGH operons
VASDTRHRLIRTTGRLLRTQGYAGTGLNQIVAEADAPKGSMYFHFPGGKAELAAAAVDRFATVITNRLRDGLERSATVSEAVTEFFDSYIEHLERTSFREGCAVATVALDASGQHEVLAESTSRALHEWVDTLAAALEAEGRDPAEAHGLATLVIATIEGTIVIGKGERSTEPLVVTRDALRAILDAPPRSLDRLDAR